MEPTAIIVLAYGPGQVTKDAVERTRRLAGGDTRVIVVPALGLAGRFVRRQRSPRVETIEAPGRAGLGAVLRDLDGVAIVAVVHDDVLLSRATLEALLTEHAASGALTVPWSNDRASDASLGALPPAKRAAAAVAQAEQGAARHVARTIRPNCFVGTVAQITGMLPSRLTVARTQLEPRDVDVVVAAGAVVAHDNTCLDQLETPRRRTERPLITAALIVRDEEELLPDCLASLDGVVDRIVVCDTGSIDDTVAVARAAGAQVIERRWRDDFAWARNEVLDAVGESDYVLQIDADERLIVEDPEELRRYLATDLHDSDAFDIHIHNLDDGGRVANSHLGLRLFRPDGIRYSGALHELPMRGLRTPDHVRLAGVSLAHLGYTSEMIQQRDKSRRNVEIAEAEYAEEPNAAHALNLARSLLLNGAADERLTALLEEASRSDQLLPRARAHALSLLAGIAFRSQDVERARDLAMEALELVPLDDEAAWVAASANLALGRWQDVIETHRWRHAAASDVPYSTTSVGRARELVALARAHVAADDLATAAATVRELLELAPVVDLDSWRDIVAILVLAEPASAWPALMTAALHDPTGGCVEAVAQTYDAADAATFVAEVVAAGALTERSLQVGMTVAMVARRDDLLEQLAGQAGSLPVDVLDRIMQRAAERQMPRGASAIGRALLEASRGRQDQLVSS